MPLSPIQGFRVVAYGLRVRELEPKQRKRGSRLNTGLLSNHGEKSTNCYLIMAPLRKSIKV